MARLDRKARHFVEGAVLASVSLLVVSSSCLWSESGERVRHDTERRPAERASLSVREQPAEASPEHAAPAPPAVATQAATSEPAASASAPASTARPAREPALCPGAVRLTGSIVVAGQPEHSLAALSKGSGTSLLRVGQSLDELQLVALRPRRAYMRQPTGEYCTLHLLPSAEPAAPQRVRAAAGKAPARNASPFTDQELSAAIRSAGPDHYVVSRAFATQALGKLVGARGLGRLRPAMRDGRLEGLRVSGVKRDSPLARLGIRNGDVLRTLNGISLGSADGLMEAYPLLQRERSLSLAMFRKGQPRTLQYTLE